MVSRGLLKPLKILGPPSEGQKIFVSKVWVVGCLNFCLEVTKTYQVKKVEKNPPGPGKVPKTAIFMQLFQYHKK